SREGRRGWSAQVARDSRLGPGECGRNRQKPASPRPPLMHNDTLYASVSQKPRATPGPLEASPEPMRLGSTMNAPLLDRVRVIEVAILAPNMVGMHLADLGADVIKVEMPGRGDYTWSIGPVRAGGLSFLHLRWNRGKRSIALDLRTPEGADVFLDLVRGADV